MGSLITPSSNLGGQCYPFLHGRQWAIHSQDVIDDPEWLAQVRADRQVALEYAKGGKLTRIYCDGMNVEAFLQSCGLEVSVNKGPFVTSKRLSRLFRPYFLWGFFDHLDVTYDVGLDKKLWDGAGLISRKALLKLMPCVDALPPEKAKRLRHELLTLKRVEFTVMTERGQDKGHALVVDDLEHDLVLPCDTKSEVRLTNGQQFLGIMPVHAVDHMNLDVQSHINLRPFYSESDLKLWLEAEAKLFLESIRSNRIMPLLARISSTEELTDWWVQEWAASEGEAMWSTSVIKALAAQHRNKITNTNGNRFKLPVPGGRYYVFSAAVGHKKVDRGYALLSLAEATVWVASEDYPQIAQILGGADQDDALWIQPFTDHDGERKLLCWRSPNQVGEYVILKPAAESHEIAWATTGEPVIFPAMDSRKLPERIDKLETRYLHLIQPVVSKPGPYTLDAMHEGLMQMIANAGALGMLCNLLIVYKALYDVPPMEMPDYLGNVIDAVVKNGNDTSQVKAWTYTKAQALVRHTNAIPQSQHHRIVGLCGKTLAKTVVPTENHWLDQMYAMLHEHLLRFDKATKWLMNQAMPPKEVFEYGQGWQDVAADIRSLYSQKLSALRGDFSDEKMAQIAGLVEHELDQWPQDAQRHILCALMGRIYLTDRAKDQDGNDAISDSICFLIGQPLEDGTRAEGIVHRTIEALRYIGVLKSLVDTPEGVMTYTRRPQPSTMGLPVKLNGRWFSELLKDKVYNRMGDVPVTERDSMKQLIAEAAARGRYNGQTFQIKHEGDRMLVMEGERIWAYVQRGHEYRLPNDTVTILYAQAQDGNLHAIVS